MRVILLAAGQGMRLRPYTDDRPKCMVALAGRPLLAHQLEVLRQRQLDDIVVVGGYRADQLPSDLRVVHNPAFATTNMVTSLMCSRDWWPTTGSVLVAYTDIVYERRVLDAITGATSSLAVAVDLEWDVQFRDRFGDRYLNEAETLRLRADGTIREIGLPVTQAADVEGQYLGLMKFSAGALQDLGAIYEGALATCGDGPWMRGRSIRQAFMTDMLQHLIDNGRPVHAVQVRRGWLEVDQVSDLERYQAALEGEGLAYFRGSAS